MYSASSICQHSFRSKLKFGMRFCCCFFSRLIISVQLVHVQPCESLLPRPSTQYDYNFDPFDDNIKNISNKNFAAKYFDYFALDPIRVRKRNEYELACQ